MKTTTHRQTLARRRTAAVAALTAGALALTGCAASSAGEDAVALDYWLWDANQLPAYQSCVEAFEEENPDLEVRISQYGWDDYWRKLTALGAVAGMVAGTITVFVWGYNEVLSGYMYEIVPGFLVNLLFAYLVSVATYKGDSATAREINEEFDRAVELSR